MSVLLDCTPLIIPVEMAVALNSDTKAAVLQQVNRWCEFNKANERNFYDGHYWMHNSYDDWSREIPWKSRGTIIRAITELEKDGYLISSRYNKKKYDKTKWYRVDYEKCSDLLATTQNEYRPLLKMSRPIPQGTTQENYYITRVPLTDVRDTDIYPSFDRKDTVFERTERLYGATRVRDMADFVDWYIDEGYPRYVGKKHPDVSRALRIVHAEKLLECVDALSTGFSDINDEYVKNALSALLELHEKDVDPQIQYATTPSVLGYWLEQETGLEFYELQGTEYQFVENFY